jgi:hypothetical protein
VVEDAYLTYCFKPKVIKDFLGRSNSQTFMWADASTRYLSNPEEWAKRMMHNGIDLAGVLGGLGMGENTHAQTFKYLNISVHQVSRYREIVSGHIMVNLERPTVVEQVLNRWIACAVDACSECMAPIGSKSKLPPGTKIKVGSTKYVIHRQDQSVLGLLAYTFRDNLNGTLALNEKDPKTGYMSVRTQRSPTIKNASQLLELYV